MSVAVPFLVAGIAGFGASKLVSKITGNETLGMIAGIAVGGFAGSMATPAAAAGAAPGAVPAAATPAGSTGAGVGSAVPTTGGGGFTGSGVHSAAGTGTGAGGVGGTGLLAKVGLTPDRAWTMGGSIAQGVGKYKQDQKMIDIYDERNDLMRDKFNQENKTRDEQSAYGLTRGGESVDLNVGEQLSGVQGTFSNLNQLNTVQRPEGGYLAGYGRFMKPESEEERV